MTRYHIRQRLRELIMGPSSEHSEEPVAQEEEPSLDSDKILRAIIGEARQINDDMSDWEPEEELLVQVLEDLPPTVEELMNGDYAEILVEIQRKYMMSIFMDRFKLKVYEFQKQIAKLDCDEYFKHYIQIGIISTQLVQLLALVTQKMVQTAYEHKAKETKKKADEAKETKEPTSWMGWGMVGDA